MSNGDFNSGVDPVAVIKHILDGYPFGVGIFRELLQNSDDAKASKQIFLLDKRQHTVHSLCKEKLRSTQGPALIAYNDAVFQDTDWKALQRIYQSSKQGDTSKIGRFGIGFRSSYHITDTPQVMSGDSFAVFDPLEQFTDTETGGFKMGLSDVPNGHRDSLNTEWFEVRSDAATADRLTGTIVRLPLRTKPSRFGDEPITVTQIQTLLQDFVTEEMDIVLLFLSHIKSVEVYTIQDGDVEPRFTFSASASQSGMYSDGAYTTSVRTITTTGPGIASVSRTWRILHASHERNEAAEILSTRLGYSVLSRMEKDKMTPEVALAIPTSQSSGDTLHGRLFTYLPLPLYTAFPCHTHGLFALDTSRQNLRNSWEKGMVTESVDRLRVEWNRLLFDTFIPRAYARLLSALVKHDTLHGKGVLRAWPRRSTDDSIWQSTPNEVLKEVLSLKAKVWPTTPEPGHADEQFSILEEVFVTQSGAAPSEETLIALTSAGLKTTQLPAHLYTLVQSGEMPVKFLDPGSVREALLSKPDRMPTLSQVEIDLISIYLASSTEISALLDLPLMPTIAGNRVSLRSSSIGCTTYVLLDDEAKHLFGRWDDQAIALEQLPEVIQTILLQQPEGSLNVRRLSCDIVTSYLATAFQRFDISSATAHEAQIPTQAVEWFNAFWIWVASWTFRKSLYPSISSLALLPTAKGGLQLPCLGIFSAEPISTLQPLLQTVGVPFTHPSANERVRTYLRERGIIKSISNIPDLLNHLRPEDVSSLGEAGVSRLRAHLVSAHTRLNDTEKDKLRRLPIFQRLDPSTDARDETSSVKSVEHASGYELKCVPEGPRLPMIPNVFYTPDLSLARLIHPSIQTLSEVQTITLAISHFPSQPRELQLLFLRRINEVRGEIPQRVLEVLRSTTFVPTASGILGSPANLIDPRSEVAELFLPKNAQHPDVSTKLRKKIVEALQVLGFLNDKLTVEMARERITFIARGNAQGSQIAEKLLDILETQPFDLRLLEGSVGYAWLPTEAGLCPPSQCRDKRDELLCKGVLPLLKRGREIRSSRLRKVFGWDQNVQLSVVIERFKQVVATDVENNHRKNDLRSLICEFGSRVTAIDNASLLELQNCVEGQLWIPVSGSGGLVSTVSGVFLLEGSLPVFRRISSSLANNFGTKTFLKLMGCTESPTSISILPIIQQHRDLPSTQIIALLALLAVEHIPESQIDQHFVPDYCGTLRKPSDVLYNDMGVTAARISIPFNKFLAHSDLRGEIARRLNISFLSGLANEVDEDDDEEDMKEDLTTRISNVLHQYTKEQAIAEFIANAADAKATGFSMCIDERAVDSQSALITDTMRQFQREPSLVIHNEQVFSNDDWKGLIRVGRGSKQTMAEDQDVIGRFGLGALSMFHFTEVAMIVSGKQVVFLDPARKHVDGERKRASRKISLENMKQLFPGHLESIQGMFGFSSSLAEYKGTIFKLSLRTAQQARNSPLSREWYTPQAIRTLAEDFYQRHASSALLFVKINSLAFSARNSKGSESQLWSVSIPSRTPLQTRHELHALEEVTVERSHCRTPENQQQTWHVLLEHIPREVISKDLRHVTAKYRIKRISVGLAGLISIEPAIDGRLFFGLPLTTTTSLPVHVHASFILSDDRRNVRFDGNEESQYNKWLTEKRVAQLYLRFLETWPISRKLETSTWWPKRSPNDQISRAIIDSIIHQFPNSELLICDTMFGPRISPVQSVFIPRLSAKGRHKVLKLLCPPSLAHYPPGLVHDAELPGLDVSYVKKVLQDNDSEFCSLFDEGKIKIHHIVDFIMFFQEEKQQKDLCDLPLVPLVDGGLTRLAAKGKSNIYTWRAGHKILPWDHLFDPSRFLHPEVEQEAPHIMADLQLNVSELDQHAVVDFIQSRFQEVDKQDMQPDNQEWIKRLWSLMECMPIERSAIASFPLVPARNVGSLTPECDAKTYISLNKCDSSDTIPPPAFLISHTILEALQKLGMTFVEKDDKYLPSNLRNFLINFNYSLEALLLFLDGLSSNRIVELSSPELAEWIIGELRSLQSAEYLQNNPRRQEILQSHLTARKLPIWKVIRVTRPGGQLEDAFASAAEMIIIPREVKLVLAKTFLQKDNIQAYSAHHPTLSKLKVATQSMSQFQASLRFPPTMPTVSPDYVRLLEILVENPEAYTPMLVPSAAGLMVDVKTLYTHSEHVFRDAFSTERRRFLHPSLESLEPKLNRFGLQHKLDFTSFKAAAEAIHSDVTTNNDPNQITRRAGVVFDAYSTRLYGNIWSDSLLWQQLDHLRFIPRAVERRRDALSSGRFDQFAIELPTIVSPAQLVSLNFESVAWTQRALFPQDQEPSEQLGISYPALGTPTVTEVIRHLKILVTKVAAVHPYDSSVISDLRATYSWLNDHREQARELWDVREPLFLNVNDPNEDRWEWKSAPDLVFNSPDEGRRQCVRSFLNGFKPLLILVGAHEIKRVSAPTNIKLALPEEALAGMRQSFIEMRRQNWLTDVFFGTQDGRQLPAHRVVLAAQSEHFKIEFTGEHKEAKSSGFVIQMPDLPKSVESMLDYFYYGSIPSGLEYEELVDLFRLSNYIDDRDMRVRVQLELVEFITPDTCAYLREKAEDFDNGGPLAIKCAEFNDANREALAAMAMENNSLN